MNIWDVPYTNLAKICRVYHLADFSACIIDRRAPVINTGLDGLIFYGHEDETLNKVTVEQLLSVLTEKEKETILLWSYDKTLEQIAKYISVKYEGRDPDNPLSARAMGVRVHKILAKLRKHAETSVN